MPEVPSLPSSPDRAILERAAREELAALEAAAESAHPGILDLLRVYGGYEDAIRESQDYLNALNSEVAGSTSNRSEA